MSYAEDFNHDLDPEFLGICSYDTDSISDDMEYISSNIWRMKDGNTIAIKDMSTSHITNCIKLIQRQLDWRRKYLPIFFKELDRRKLLQHQ